MVMVMVMVMVMMIRAEYRSGTIDTIRIGIRFDRYTIRIAIHDIDISKDFYEKQVYFMDIIVEIWNKRTRWIQYTPPPPPSNFVGRGYKNVTVGTIKLIELIQYLRWIKSIDI